LLAVVWLSGAEGLAAGGAPRAPGCESIDVDAVVAGVQARYDAVRDLDARFEQKTRSVMMGGAGLGDDSPTTGRVQIAKPGRMRWHYEAPRESLVLSDGKTLWIYDVPAKEVTRAEVTSGYLAGAALQFLLGEGAITDSFEVALLGCTGDRVTLELLPKKDASYEKLEIVVDGEHVVVGTTIFDLFGNVTELRFEQVRFDRSPPIERFRWQPIEGVTVVDLAATPGG
jgi:outer membrane lipoprotein carrier protein